MAKVFLGPIQEVIVANVCRHAIGTTFWDKHRHSALAIEMCAFQFVAHRAFVPLFSWRFPPAPLTVGQTRADLEARFNEFAFTVPRSEMAAQFAKAPRGGAAEEEGAVHNSPATAASPSMSDAEAGGSAAGALELSVRNPAAGV